MARGAPIADIDEYHPPYGVSLPPYSEDNPYKEYSPPNYENLASDFGDLDSPHFRRMGSRVLSSAASASCLADVVINPCPSSMQEIDLNDDGEGYLEHFHHHPGYILTDLRHPSACLPSDSSHQYTTVQHHNHHHNNHHHHQQQGETEQNHNLPHHHHNHYRHQRHHQQDHPHHHHLHHHQQQLSTDTNTGDPQSNSNPEDNVCTCQHVRQPSGSAQESDAGDVVSELHNCNNQTSEASLPDTKSKRSIHSREVSQESCASSLPAKECDELCKEQQCHSGRFTNIAMTDSSGSFLSASQSPSSIRSHSSSPALLPSHLRSQRPRSPPAIQKRTYITWI